LSLVKSGFITILGPANAGKSTLLNALLKTPLSIISPKPQTTRNSLSGILNSEEHQAQLIITDTPGILKKTKSLLDKKLQDTILNTIDNTDVVLFLLPTNENLVDYQDLINKIKEKEKKILIIFNKNDILKKVLSKEEEALGLTCLFISALKDNHYDDLIKKLADMVFDPVLYYPDDILSDRTERFFVKEYIRETLLLLLNNEIPHQCFVDIEEMQERPQKNIFYVKAIIYLERENHKKIVLGKNGSMIKAIGSQSRKRIEEFLNQKVFLDLQVKVKEKWRDDPSFLEKLEYY